LPQQAIRGRRSIEKLYGELKQCSSALIVMTCNEQDNFGTPKAREDLMYEIGLLQGVLGLNNICILHENSISPPRDLPGIVCIPYVKGQIESVCHLLKQEICAS
jgi:predicted nucleotide-binding protein